jgi:hypothetical protein
MSDESGTFVLGVIMGDEHRTVVCKDENVARLKLDVARSLSASTVFTPDARPFIEMGVEFPAGLIDLRVPYGKRLLTRSREGGDIELISRLKFLDSLIDSERRARRLAKIDNSRHSLFRGLDHLLHEWLSIRSRLFRELGQRTPAHMLGRDRLDVVRALYRIERSGIQRDSDVVKFELDPYMGKTGRFRVSSGFNCMAIPHGDERRKIVSRFSGGMICSFDFNAIDYRRIVSSTEDARFIHLYDGANDFHERTCQILRGYPDDPWSSSGEHPSPLLRKIVKQATYTSVYGGSEQTLAKQLGIDQDRCHGLVESLGKVMAPIHDFRNRLYQHYLDHGSVTLPTGRLIEILPDAHPGKVLGLYAQSYSSWVFERALVWVDRNIDVIAPRSVPIFPVHDELVFDFHPDEIGQIDEIARGMECPDHDSGQMRSVVKVKKGKNYDETG